MKHIAIIMDGNRRFAKNNNKPVSFGHKAGADKIIEVCEFAKKAKIQFLTLFAFSTENWKREKEEVSNLILLLENFLNKETEKIIKNKICVKIIGEISIYSKSLKQKLLYLQEQTLQFTEFTLIIALNYGSRAEILQAVQKALESKTLPKTEEEFEAFLQTSGVPNPELLIRTGGDFRLSNFLLWQLAYSELFFTETLWPEFKEEDFLKAIKFFNSQKRNFGK